MLTSLDFCKRENDKKSENSMKVVNIEAERKKEQNLFRKDVVYNNVKVHEKQVSILSPFFWAEGRGEDHMGKA